MWVEGANPNTPKSPSSHSWGRFLLFSAHIYKINQKVIKGYLSLFTSILLCHIHLKIMKKCNNLLLFGKINIFFIKNHDFPSKFLTYFQIYFDLWDIHYGARVTWISYLPVKRIGNKIFMLLGHHNGYK
jgi:hypothetical protein